MDKKVGVLKIKQFSWTSYVRCPWHVIVAISYTNNLFLNKTGDLDFRMRKDIMIIFHNFGVIFQILLYCIKIWIAFGLETESD